MSNAKDQSTPKYERLPNPADAAAPLKFRWMKHEFPIMLAIFILWVIYLLYDFAVIMRHVVSKENIVGLSPGYFGIPRDTNDGQWRGWREHLSLFLIVATLHLGISTVIKKNLKSPEKTPLLVFHLIFGGVYVAYIEQSGFAYWLLFTLGFFTLIQIGHRWKVFPIILWSLCLTVLYTNETYGGYGFQFISEEMHLNMVFAPVRWNIIFNMTILRMISFGMDMYWAHKQTPISQKNNQVLSYRHRQETHQPLKNYNLLNYYSYLLYVPLFLTGPIITFNAWISQIYIPQKEYSNKAIVKYGIRYVLTFLCFEVFLHLYYVNALSVRHENMHIWQTYFKTHHLLLLGMFELFFLWFKFLVIWRFSRLWALIDGIESPENMNRCVANNYCFEGFWRSWHRSFNQWLIRYIFIPCGGSKYKLLNVWVVFSFVAIWHDMNLNLLLWSWIICLSLMPEMAIKWYFSQRKNAYLWDKVWFRYAAAALCTVIILCMIIANLIGYGTGYETLLLLIKRMENIEDIGTIVAAFMVVFINCNMSYKIREWEAEEGKAKGF